MTLGRFWGFEVYWYAFLCNFTSLQVRSEYLSNTWGFFARISPNRKQPKKAMQCAVQTVWKSNFFPIVFFNFCLNIFKVSKVIALQLRFFLFLRFLAFLNPLRRDLVNFLLLSNFLKPRKLWILFRWTKYLLTVFAETLPYS